MWPYMQISDVISLIFCTKMTHTHTNRKESNRVSHHCMKKLHVPWGPFRLGKGINCPLRSTFAKTNANAVVLKVSVPVPGAPLEFIPNHETWYVYVGCSRFPTVFAVGKQCGHSILKLWTQSERIGQLNEMLVNRPANAGKSPATRWNKWNQWANLVWSGPVLRFSFPPWFCCWCGVFTVFLLQAT